MFAVESSDARRQAEGLLTTLNQDRRAKHAVALWRLVTAARLQDRTERTQRRGRTLERWLRCYVEHSSWEDEPRARLNALRDQLADMTATLERLLAAYARTEASLLVEALVAGEGEGLAPAQDVAAAIGRSRLAARITDLSRLIVAVERRSED